MPRLWLADRYIIFDLSEYIDWLLQTEGLHIYLLDVSTPKV